MLSAPIAAAFISWSLARNRTWSSARRWLLWSTGFTWIGLVVMFRSLFFMLAQSGGKFGPEVMIGWPNRLLMVTCCAWLITIARHADQLKGQEP